MQINEHLEDHNLIVAQSLIHDSVCRAVPGIAESANYERSEPSELPSLSDDLVVPIRDTICRPAYRDPRLISCRRNKSVWTKFGLVVMGRDDEGGAPPTSGEGGASWAGGRGS